MISTLQFYVPRAALDAIAVETLRPYAQAAGIVDDCFGYDAAKAGPGLTRITCSIPMCVFLVEALEQRAAEGDGKHAGVTAACTNAVTAALDALGAAANEMAADEQAAMARAARAAEAAAARTLSHAGRRRNN